MQKKQRSWICSCRRKNDPDDQVCGFCQQPREVKGVAVKAKKSKQKAYDELFLWPIFSKYIRLRDTNADGAGFCFTCKRPVLWNRADCGHGIPRQHKATKYNEQNNHLQCKHCNGFEGGRREDYKAEMDRLYGIGTWDKMQVASRQVWKGSQASYDIMISIYSKKVAELMLTKNFKNA